MTKDQGIGGGKRPALSVIIPTKNRGETIRATISSILAQSQLPDELVIVDQSDVDNLSNILAHSVAGTGIKLVHLWRRDLTGLAQARNVGFDASSGEIVLFFDDDVFLEPAYIKGLLQHYQNDVEGNLGGAGGLITNDQIPEHWLSKWFLRGPFADPRSRFQAHPAGRFPTTALSGCNMSYRRAAFAGARANESLKGYSGGEDWELGQRISRRHELILTADAKLEHRKSPVNRQSERIVMAAAIRSQLAFYRSLHSTRERLHPKMILANLWYRTGMSVFAMAYLRRGDVEFAKSTLDAAWRAS